MLLNSDYFDPQTLSDYTRTAALNLPINQFRLRTWLPDRFIDDLTYRFVRGGDSLLSAAPYRAFDAESTVASRPGLTRVSGELPPISRKILLTEYDRLRQRANPDASIQASILSDAERVVRQISARLEIARGDALVNGSVSIEENGVHASVDFDRAAGMEVTALTLWNLTGSADPLSDLRTWQQAYIDQNGEAPGCFLTSTRVQGLLLQNATIRGLVGSLVGIPTIVNQMQLNSLLMAHGLPPIETYDVRFGNAAGVPTRVIPDHLGLLLPAPVAVSDFEGTDLGATFFGTTAESLDASYGLAAGAEAGIVAGVYRQEDPISLWTKGAAIAIPVLATPNLAMACTVASQ